MLREKYWFPGMNHLTNETIEICFDCQVAPKSHRQEPIKPSVTPEEPWEQVSIDLGGSYHDSHYNLVAIGQRTRYPVIDAVSSTGFKQTKEKLKETFVYLGLPRRVTSDKGPPFISEQFKDFAKEEGFVHHRVTRIHPRANGQVERFMETLNKTEQIAHLQGKSGPDRNMAVQDMLMAYRDTPHPATGILYSATEGEKQQR